MGIKHMSILLGAEARCRDYECQEECQCFPEFQQGETIKGELFLCIGGGKPHKLYSLELYARGKAKSLWSDTESNSYSETEELFHVDIPLAGQPIRSLKPGEHHFEFTFQVPNNLPPSFGGGAGKVKYSFKARAVSDGIFSFNAKAKNTFLVLPDLDLNESPEAAEPLNLAEEAHESLFESFGNYNMCMARQGYVEGEIVHIYIDGREQLFQSLSKKPKNVVKLKQEVICLAGKKSHVSKVTHVKFHPMDWRHIELIIPEDVGTTIDSKLCRIVNSTYYIKIKSSRIELHLPIVIGTVPIKVKSSAGGF